YAAHIEIYIPHAGIFSLDSVNQYRQSFVGGRIIKTTATRKMCDLNAYILRLRKELFQENAGFLCTIRAMVIDVGVQVYGDCHAMPIRRAEHPTNLGEVLRIVDIHVGVSEVKLETGAQVRVLRAPRDLLDCVCSQRIDATETN